jgi:CBS domain containing-hemolysin-like protein
MTPRPRVRFLDADDPVEEILALAARTGHSRFPVQGEDVDDLVGVVHFKDALAVPREERQVRTAAQVARELRAVPSTMPLDATLESLREGLQIVVVVDEYGGTDGILTLEDLVEELVGEIEDEQDRPLSPHRHLGGRRWSLSGLLRPDEAGEITELDLPEARESDTLGGLVTEHLERFAELGDEVVVDARDVSERDEDGVAPPVRVRLTVTRLDGWRVDRLLLAVEPAEEEDRG